MTHKSKMHTLLASGFVLVAGLVAASQVSANPGVIADHCVYVTKRSMHSHTSYRFENDCNYNIFVFYCGNITTHSGFCNGSRGANYYTHSFNLRPGAAMNFGVERNGTLHWGACEGSIGFSNDGHFNDDRNGRYWCLRR